MATGPESTAAHRTTVFVFRALPGLGDFLCLVPALRALRAARPDATVHLVGLESTRDLAGRFGRYIDEFHAFPGHPGLPDQPAPDAATFDAFIARICDLQPDLALQLHGSGQQSNAIVGSFGASLTAGFHAVTEPPPADGTFLAWDESESEAARPLRLLRALGMPARNDRLEFPLDAETRGATHALLTPLARDPYVVVHPGAARPWARWDAEGFAAVIRWLAESGLRVVLTGGAAEAGITSELASRVPGTLDLAGRTGLDELAWILDGARLVVLNDTGVSHLAAAIGVPSVVVFPAATATHVSRWAPADRARHRPVHGSVAAVLAQADHLLHSASAAA